MYSHVKYLDKKYITCADLICMSLEKGNRKIQGKIARHKIIWAGGNIVIYPSVGLKHFRKTKTFKEL